MESKRTLKIKIDKETLEKKTIKDDDDHHLKHKQPKQLHKSQAIP